MGDRLPTTPCPGRDGDEIMAIKDELLLARLTAKALFEDMKNNTSSGTAERRQAVKRWQAKSREARELAQVEASHHALLEKIAAKHHKLAMEALDRNDEDAFDFHWETGSEAQQELDRLRLNANA